jgi:Ca2+-binding EF-hand superfamily protein
VLVCAILLRNSKKKYAYITFLCHISNIQFLELLKMAANKGKKAFNQLNEEDYKIIADFTNISTRQAKEVFDQFHKEVPSGKLNRDQFAAFFKSIDPEKCKLDDHKKFTDLIFKSFDSDNDGVLTVNEILVGFAVITKGDVDRRLEYIFNIYDSDKNGELTIDEIKYGFKGVFIMSGVDANDFVIETKANNKMNKLDSDRDGTISKAEFIQAIKANKKLSEGLFFM